MRDPSRPVGMNTMIGMLEHVSQRERKRTVMVVGPILGVLALLAVGALIFAVLRPASAEKRLQGAIERVKPSVYTVVLRGSNGSEEAGGTAWVLQKDSRAGIGLLGTNAHVAELFALTARGVEMLVRSQDSPPRTLRVKGVTLHPGYRHFQAMQRSILLYKRPNDQLLQLPTAFDVALLEVEPADVEQMGEPLRLAEDSTLRNLKAGELLAYVGYPVEGENKLDPSKPIARAFTGTLNGVATHTFTPATRPEDAVSLLYNLVAYGGGSGSPVINADGEVVGLISSGAVLGQTQSGRIPLAGVTYGPRVDIIAELAGKRAEAVHGARIANIETDFLEKAEQPPQRGPLLYAFMLRVVPDEVLAALDTSSGTAQRVFENPLFSGSGTLSQPGEAGSITTEAVQVRPGHWYFVAAVSYDQPSIISGRLNAHNRGWSNWDTDGAFNWWNSFDSRTAGTLRVQVKGEPSSRKMPSKVDVYIVEIPRKPQERR